MIAIRGNNGGILPLSQPINVTPGNNGVLGATLMDGRVIITWQEIPEPTPSLSLPHRCDGDPNGMGSG